MAIRAPDGAKKHFLAWKSDGVKFWTISFLTLTGPCNAQNSAKMFLSQRLHLLGVQQSTQALHSNHYQLLTDDFHILYCQTTQTNPIHGILRKVSPAKWVPGSKFGGSLFSCVALQVLSQALTDDVKCQALWARTQSVRSSNLNVAKSERDLRMLTLFKS